MYNIEYYMHRGLHLECEEAPLINWRIGILYYTIYNIYNILYIY